MRAKFVNEVFDVLTWSKDNLEPAISKNVEDSHRGEYGEKIQKALLKCQSGEEIIKWHNNKFEIASLHEDHNFERSNDAKKALRVGEHRKEEYRIMSGYYTGTVVPGEKIGNTIKTIFGNFHAHQGTIQLLADYKALQQLDSE